MKTIKLDKKLLLKKETISDLNNKSMQRVKGGQVWTVTCTCETNCTCQVINCTKTCGGPIVEEEDDTVAVDL